MIKDEPAFASAIGPEALIKIRKMAKAMCNYGLQKDAEHPEIERCTCDSDGGSCVAFGLYGDLAYAALTALEPPGSGGWLPPYIADRLPKRMAHLCIHGVSLRRDCDECDAVVHQRYQFKNDLTAADAEGYRRGRAEALGEAADRCFSLGKNAKDRKLYDRSEVFTSAGWAIRALAQSTAPETTEPK